VDKGVTPDSVVAEMLAGATGAGSLATLWSSCIGLDSRPGDTLKGAFAPDYKLPELLPKTVAFPGLPPDAGADYEIVGKLGEGGMGA
jgi:hypothetical protein